MSTKKNTEVTLWEHLKMPPLTHCSVQRACELLGVKTSDILNWLDKLTPMINVQESIFEVDVVLTVESEKLSKLEGEHLIDAISIYSGQKIEPARPFTVNTFDYFSEKEDQLTISTIAYYSGFLHAIDGVSVDEDDNLLLVISDLSAQVLPSSDSAHLYCLEYFDGAVKSIDNLIVHSIFSYNEYYTSIPITIDDIYISRRDLEKIYESGVKGNEIHQNYSHEMKQNELKGRLTERKENLTVHQFNMIYALLKIAGITDDEIKNTSPEQLNKRLSEIGKISKVSVPQPDKNTWKKWKEKLEMVMRS